MRGRSRNRAVPLRGLVVRLEDPGEELRRIFGRTILANLARSASLGSLLRSRFFFRSRRILHLLRGALFEELRTLLR